MLLVVDDAPMPILTELSKAEEWIEPDDVPRSIVTYGYTAEKLDGIELDFHSHAKSQIMLVQRGALSCEGEEGLFVDFH